MHAPQHLQAVAGFAHLLDTEQVPWCVLRNHETFPQPRTAGGDIDLLLGCSGARAYALFVRACEAAGACIAKVSVKSDGTLIGVTMAAPALPALRVDLFTDVTWSGHRLVDRVSLLAARRRSAAAWVPTPAHEAAASLLVYLMHHGQVKPAYKLGIQGAAGADRAGFVACLEPVWGPDAAGPLTDHAAAGDWAWFAEWARRNQRRLRWRAWRRPLGAARLAANGWARVMHPPGLSVAFLGPDGVGKSTIATAYRARLEGLFTTQLQLHLRPRWLPMPAASSGGAGHGADDNTRPHARPAHGSLASLLRLAFFWVDYVVGHWARVRPCLARGGLVTFDRYVDDFVIDQLRFRLALPQWCLQAFARAVPRPDLTFALHARAAVVHERKQELGVEEIERQLAAMGRRVAGDEASLLVDTERPVDQIVTEMERATLAFLVRRAAGGPRGWLAPAVGGVG